MSVLRVKAFYLTNLVTSHDARNFLPHELEAIPDDLHCLSIALSVLLSLDLSPLSSIAEKLRLLLETLRSSRSLLEFLERSFRWFSSSFSFSSTERQGVTSGAHKRSSTSSEIVTRTKTVWGSLRTQK